MIYVLQLESLKERYTYWWEEYIPAEIKKAGKKYKIIDGDVLTDKVETGTVLDASSTNYYKFSQLQKICEMFYKGEVLPGDQFFVADIWFPGIEAIRYMSQLYDIQVSIWGVWHAGSTTMNDFAEPMHPWSKHFEIGFLNICNGVFVGSEYSKKAIIDRLLYDVNYVEKESIASRIHAFGMPLNFDDLQQYRSNVKEKIILFPHRPDEEKNPHIYINIINALSMYWEDFSDYLFVFCTSKEKYQSQSMWINASLAQLKRSHPQNVLIREGLTKEEYYKLLGKASLTVSVTSEENFGYCAVEALAVGCQVLLPKAFSHAEIVEEDENLLYNDYDDLLNKIPLILKRPVAMSELMEYVKPYAGVVNKWLQIMSS